MLWFMADNDTHDPTAILARSAAAYAALQTYQDHGNVVVETDKDAKIPLDQKLWFSTYFKKPRFFRFAFLAPVGRMDGPMLPHVLWTTGGIVHISSPLYPFEWFPSLSMAIGAAAGVSHSGAYRVPILLMPEICGSPFPGFPAQKPKLNEEYISAASSAGEQCDIVRTKVMSTVQTDTFISRSRSIILKVEEQITTTPGGPPKEADWFSRVMYDGVMWIAENWISKRPMPQMDPFTFTTKTTYERVILNEPIPDSAFSEAGRRS
jgi:hypothetical protein